MMIGKRKLTHRVRKLTQKLTSRGLFQMLDQTADAVASWGGRDWGPWLAWGGYERAGAGMVLHGRQVNNAG